MSGDLEGERVLVEQHRPRRNGETMRTGVVTEIHRGRAGGPSDVDPQRQDCYTVDLDGAGETHVTRSRVIPLDAIPESGVVLSDAQGAITYDALRLMIAVGRCDWIDLPDDRASDDVAKLARELGLQLALAGPEAEQD